MKISLINPPYLRNYGRLNIGKNFMFPMGLGYLAASLELAGHTVEIFEPEIQNSSRKDIYDHLREWKPSLVAFTATTSTIAAAAEISQIAKDACQCKTVAGGVHVSALPELTMRQFPTFDFLCVGEGDHLVVELAEQLESLNPNFAQIAGLVYGDDGKVLLNQARLPISNMEVIPFPARHLVDLRRYRPQPIFYKGIPFASINSSRGCPAHCVFCASFNAHGRRFRPHSPEYVLEEIDQLVNKYGIRHLHFVDDTFTLDKKRAYAICEGIIARKYHIKWHCYARVDNIDRPFLALMKKAGLFSIFYGIETGDPAVLKSLKKGTTLEQARNAMALSNDLGLKTICSFLFGNQKDTPSTIRETLRFALELKPTIASLNVMVPFPGTQAFRETFDGRYPTDWNNFVIKGREVLSKVDGLTDRELKRFHTYAFWRFYGRPLQIIRIFRHISNARELAGYIRGTLGLALRSLEWWFR
jgi:anaerobic magnesium-protoporphyrin IX monomethyl ester cyclase